MKKDKLITKIAQDTYHVRKVFESCKTKEQLDNTRCWACSMIDKWYNMFDKGWGLFDSACIWPYVKRASNDLDLFDIQAKKRLKKRMNKKNNINEIRQGHWD